MRVRRQKGKKKGELRPEELCDATSGLFPERCTLTVLLKITSQRSAFSLLKHAKLSFDIIQMVYGYDRVRFPLHMVHVCVSIYTLP